LLEDQSSWLSNSNNNNNLKKNKKKDCYPSSHYLAINFSKDNQYPIVNFIAFLKIINIFFLLKIKILRIEFFFNLRLELFLL
jgi:hypothetical protein